MSWHYPESLVILWIYLPIVALFQLLGLRLRSQRLRKLLSGSSLQRMAPRPSRRNQAIKFFCVLLAAASIVVALAGPRWGKETLHIRSSSSKFLILLDVSASMRAADIEPNRLLRAKWQLLDLLPALQGQRVAFAAFAQRSYLLCPLTEDLSTIRLYLDALDTDLVPNQGTSLATAIRQATEILASKSPASQPFSRVVLLISDGEAHDEELQRALEQAKKQEIRFFAAGIGTTTGAPVPGKKGFLRQGGQTVISKLEASGLRKIASETGGAFTVLNDTSDLQFFFDREIGPRLSQESNLSDTRTDWVERAQWFALSAWLLLALEYALRDYKLLPGRSSADKNLAQ